MGCGDRNARNVCTIFEPLWLSVHARAIPAMLHGPTRPLTTRHVPSIILAACASIILAACASFAPHSWWCDGSRKRLMWCRRRHPHRRDRRHRAQCRRRWQRYRPRHPVPWGARTCRLRSQVTKATRFPTRTSAHVSPAQISCHTATRPPPLTPPWCAPILTWPYPLARGSWGPQRRRDSDLERSQRRSKTRSPARLRRRPSRPHRPLRCRRLRTI